MSKDNQANRRNILKSIGAVGVAGLAGSGTASALSDADGVQEFGDIQSDVTLGREVEIQATGRVQYVVGVTGLLGADTTGGTVSNTAVDETHTIPFTGEFTQLSVEGDARVLVDGEPFDVDEFPRNSLEIVPDGTVTYDVSASGAVSVDRGDADQPNARTATARTSQPHRLSYEGELTYFDVDGDVTVRRNGSRVAVADLLPSTHPNRFTATAADSSYTLDTAHGVQLADGTSVPPEETVTTAGRTNGRYDGSIQAVEHENGARIEVDELKNEIVARGPRSGETQIRVKTTRGLVVDHEAFDEATLQLSAGEEATAAPHGDIERIVVGDVTIRLSQDAYPEAEDSAALQAAAETERTDEFRRLTGLVDGRIRQDAAGISGKVVFDRDRTLVRSVEHEIANPRQGDRGVVAVRQQSGTVDYAGVRYIDSSDGQTVIESTTTPTSGTRGEVETERATVTPPEETSQRRTPEETELTAAAFANSADPTADVAPSDLGPLADELSEEQLQDQGFLSFLDDVREFLSNIGASDIIGAAQWLYDILVGQLNNVAITAMSLTFATPELVAGVAEELPSASFSAVEKLAWRIAISPAVGLINLATAGFFEAIDTGGYCAACVFIAIVVRDVIVSESASYLCIYFAPATPAAVVGCVVFVEALIQFVSTYVGYTDVKDELCAGQVLDGLDPC